MELEEAARLRRQRARVLELAPVARGECQWIQALRRLDLVARVLGAQPSRPFGELRRLGVAARAELDEREVPEGVRGLALVALAPLLVHRLEQRPRVVQPARPEEDVGERETGVSSRLGSGSSGA